jgi:hypothetical protein
MSIAHAMLFCRGSGSQELQRRRLDDMRNLNVLEVAIAAGITPQWAFPLDSAVAAQLHVVMMCCLRLDERQRPRDIARELRAPGSVEPPSPVSVDLHFGEPTPDAVVPRQL